MPAANRGADRWPLLDMGESVFFDGVALVGGSCSSGQPPMYISGANWTDSVDYLKKENKAHEIGRSRGNMIKLPCIV